MDVPAWEDPRRVLARHGLAPKRGFSQNFLVSRSVVEQIVAALAPQPSEPVVELGPGLGTLTAALLRAGAQVIAIDADRDMLGVLRRELGHLPALDARHGDASALDLAAMAQGRPVALAGNLPYAITGSIFRGLVGQHACVDRAVLMVQREVRDRLLGEPGSKQYGALSVFTRAVFEVRPVCLVPAGAFHPPPRVESAVIKLTPRAQPIDAGAPEFQRCVRAAFDARRKTLRNALLQAYPGERVDGALVRAGIDGKRRGETLTVEEFARLASELDAAAASPNGRESAP
jgi:16S rRNA (adenine1518-N6/adenine1519-N6)-dimethyltransferase